MANVELVGFDKAQKNIIKKIKKAGNVGMNRPLEREEKEYKRDRRKGINPKTGRNYKRLTENWIERKSRLAGKNVTHRSYRKNKSNLTFTGQLIDSIRFFFNKTKFRVEIEVIGKHKPYIGVNGKNLGRSRTNADIAEALEDQGRPLVSLSKKLLRDIRIRYEKALRKLL